MTSQETEQQLEQLEQPEQQQIIPEVEDQLYIDFSKEKKKKNKNKKYNEPQNPTVLTEITSTLSADELYQICLGRLFEKLNANRDITKPTIIKPQISNQGSGKGRTTTFHNYISFIYSFNTKASMPDLKERTNHLTTYIKYELFCEGHVANDKLILNGKFSLNPIETILRNYINLFVKCKCNSFNTTITKCSIRRVYKNKCEACGSDWSLLAIIPKAKCKIEGASK
jgi:translation initiation factor 2 beta subunit (eIF-2beta)/eIF-5